MTHYRHDLPDTLFTLFDTLHVDDAWPSEGFTEWDREIATAVLSEVAVFAAAHLADSYQSSDATGPVFDPDTHTVTLPQDFKDSFAKYWKSQWWQLDLPAHLGGSDAPATVRWAAAEFLLGANPAAYMYMAGPGFASVVHELGNADQRRIAELMIERGWGATMVLTEPDAGSDVGAARTKAYPNADGSWRIEGVKRFITSGEHDLSENIVHLVLARPVYPDGTTKPGTKGLSLFVVPKFHVDLDTGELGPRNGVVATNMEKKMGLTASATCELSFGETEPATGWLLGDVHDGIAQMFKIIEYARMMVGTKAMAQLSAGYLAAAEYAKTRVQGPDMSSMLDKTSPRVPIVNHPDVRASLLTQRAYAQGLRALVLYTASWQDAARDPAQTELADRVNDFLLPLVKGGASEKAFVNLAAALQVLGGSGYLKDYPIEQYLRDAKIDTLYEGTTAIQGLDLFFRKMVKDNFVAFEYVMGKVLDGQPSLQLQQAVHAATELVEALKGYAMQSLSDPRAVYRVGLATTPLLMILTDILVGWLLERGAHAAQGTSMYAAKAATATWFAATVLACIPASAVAAACLPDTVMELPAHEL